MKNRRLLLMFCVAWMGLLLSSPPIMAMNGTSQPDMGFAELITCSSDDPSSPEGVYPDSIAGNPEFFDGVTCNGIFVKYDGNLDNDVIEVWNEDEDYLVATIHVDNSGDCGQVFSWEAASNIIIYKTLVKGGDAANLYDYGPDGADADGYLHSPINASGEYAAVSHVSFCYEYVPCDLVVNYDADEILCYGDLVDVTVTVTGGTEPIKLFDGDTEVGTFVDGVYVVADRPAGKYLWTVIDANECEVLLDFELFDPDPIVVDWDFDPIVCYGEGTVVTVTGSGGTGVLTLYAVDGETLTPVGPLPQDVPVLAGEITWVVIDENLCEFPIVFTVEEPAEMEVVVEVEQISCYGAEDGQIHVEMTGDGPFDICFVAGCYPDGVEPTYDKTQTATRSNLGPGEWTVVVRDANGCMYYECVTIVEPPLLEADWDADPILCYGDVVDVTVTATGGTTPIKLFDGDTEVGTFVDGVFVVADVPAGDYLWTVVDDNGCIDIVEFTLTQPPLLEADWDADPILCYGDVVDVTVT
ncbi:MAG: hypothetical protein R6U64_01960, partial [Bacteroidales bacterium]